MDAPRFPLMRLPVACSQNVLRILNPFQLFEFSLASKKCKSLARSLKFKTSEFSLHLYGSDLSIKLRFRSRNDDSNLKSDMIYYTSNSDKMDKRTFLNHLKFVFNTEKITVKFGWNVELFDFEPIFEGRHDVESIDFLTYNPGEIRRILNIIKSSKIDIMIVTRPRDILTQNVDHLRADDMFIRLEDLLIMNTKNFNTRCQMVPTKILNRFLKLWTRGSNLQLESLRLVFPFDNNFEQEEIFDRLKTTHNSAPRCFKSVNGVHTITGGHDIFRFDGTKATVRLFEVSIVSLFVVELFVWHDHCIAKETDR